MQEGFIDALVTPVFKLLAEFLPLVEKNCIKTLQINRAFWNSMQAQNNITTESIVSYLKGICGKPLDTCDSDGFHNNDNNFGKGAFKHNLQINSSMKGGFFSSNVRLYSFT